ncbi:queuosine 5'-phosphate N-glycosylase/hydrolase-like isoform X2 [Anoplolepis gracilipes]
MEFFLDTFENKLPTISTHFLQKFDTYSFINDRNVADWLFVVHTLNFSLWNPNNTKQWRVNGAQGFFGLCAAMKKISEKGMRTWDPRCYSKMMQCEFEHIFRGDDETPIPLIHERCRILHEVGEVLLNKYKGTFVECIKASDNDADNLVKLIVNEFESYRDEAVYEGLTVRFHSKAKALVSDIWAYYKDNDLLFKLNTKNMMPIMFIHYPQLFFYSFVLSYSDRLMTRLEDINKPLEYGSREELEIHGCSLFALTKLCKEVLKKSKDVASVVNTEEFNALILVDNYFTLNLSFTLSTKL